jgi:hypothetical protein
MLITEEANWGPRPLQMLKCWSEFPGYGDFVREKWGSFLCQWWGGHVLKEKLKMLKFSLKDWHQQHVKNLDGKIMTVKNKIFILDSKAELSALCEDELQRFMICPLICIIWQRKRHNTINMVLVDGTNVASVNNVRSTVFTHFSNHFKSLSANRPGVGVFSFVSCQVRKRGL